MRKTLPVLRELFRLIAVSWLLCASLLHLSWYGWVVSLLVQIEPTPEAYWANAAAPLGMLTELGRSVVVSNPKLVNLPRLSMAWVVSKVAL